MTNTKQYDFWATVCKTVRPVLSDRCLSVLSVTLVYCGQTVGWIKMKLGMQASAWPHCVRWGPSSASPIGPQPHPIFGPYLLRPNCCMDQDATCYGARPQPRWLCVRWGPNHVPPKFLAHVYYSYCDFDRTLYSSYWFVQVQVQVLDAFYF